MNLYHIKLIAGIAVCAVGVGAFSPSIDTWSTQAEPFRRVPIDPAAVQVAANWVRGRKIAGYIGGHTSYVGDSKGYYSDVPDTDRDMEKAGADVYEVRIAAETIDMMNEVPVRSFLVFTFIRTPQQPAWMPRSMGTNDPLGGNTFLEHGWL